MKKGIGLIVIILLVIGGWFVLRPGDDTAPETDNEETEHVEDLGKAPNVIPDNALVYQIDTEASTLSWQAERLTGSGHTGLAPIVGGMIIQDDEEFIGGEFIILIDEITESKSNDRFLGHVKSDDFFNTEEFPTATLEITDVVVSEDAPDSYEVTGDLTIKGQTNEVIFPANISVNDGDLTASASFEIDRTLWGITFESASLFKELGDKAIKDEIQFEVSLEAVLEEPIEE